MRNSLYFAVNSKRPCLICEKTSICFYTKDEKISICARIRENFDFKIENSRWRVFTHISGWKYTPPKKLKIVLQKAPLIQKKASLEIRNIAYQTIIELSSVIDFPNVVEYLQARGINRLENYGAMPQLREARRKIAWEVWSRLQNRFPKFEDVWEMATIPGFWVKDNYPEFWYKGNLSSPALLIPFRKTDGRIKAMQTHSFDNNLLKNKFRYHWFSVPKLLSAGANVTLHFADWKTKMSSTENSDEKQIKVSSKPLLITEGALKADSVQELQGDKGILGRKVSPIGNSGIGTAHNELLSYSQNKEVWLAFDQDFQSNDKVSQAMQKLLFNFEKMSNPIKDLKILIWDKNTNGIDEALQKKLKIFALTKNEWISRFSDR